jgi:EmrB/QacA subfamily drug resistance transporter
MAQQPMTTVYQASSFLATGRGKLTLALLCAVAFLDFVDISIVNIALPSIRRALHFSVGGLQWVPSGYLLTYGGFMLIGGRLADLLGRRRVLVTGIVTIGLASLIGGLANSSELLIAARLCQGLGAAMTLPAALSILTTTFKEGKERHTALGAWAGVGGLASTVGVLLGGLLTEGPGWRWVMFINPIACVFVLPAVYPLVSGQRPPRRPKNFDLAGAALITTGMLLLVYTLVKAPTVGWGVGRTAGGLAGALLLVVAFVINEQRHHNPLAPLSIFRINGLGFANATQLVAFAGFLATFFFLTLYMQNVLHYSPIKTGAAYIPLCVAIGISAGITSQLLSRVGTRPLIVTGALIAAAGLYWLSRIPVRGTFTGDLLPGTVLLGIGFAPVFVGVTTAASAGVPPDKAGLAASLVNASQQLGSALGLAIFTALATSRTNHLLATRASVARAETAGFQRALLVGSIFILGAAVIALRATNTRGETGDPFTSPSHGSPTSSDAEHRTNAGAVPHGDGAAPPGDGSALTTPA